MAIAIGASVLARRNPRLLFWLLVVAVCGFVPLSIWVTAGEVQAFQDAHDYAGAQQCANGDNCYQTQGATVIRTTEHPDQYSKSLDAIVTLQTLGGQSDVRLGDRDAWMRAHVGPAEAVQMQVWRGRVTELSRGGQTFRSVDYPSFDWSNVLIALVAWAATAGFAYMAYTARQLICLGSLGNL